MIRWSSTPSLSHEFSTIPHGTSVADCALHANEPQRFCLRDAVRVRLPVAARRVRSAPRIVAIGGGTGLPAVLEGLCALAAEDSADGSDRISAVVTVTDEGGSSGRLRREFGDAPSGGHSQLSGGLCAAGLPFQAAASASLCRWGWARGSCGRQPACSPRLLRSPETSVSGRAPQAG